MYHTDERNKIMNYTYRVYDALTGHEYGDVDSYDTAKGLVVILSGRPDTAPTIDLLVGE